MSGQPSLFAELRNANAELHQQTLAHPVVQGIGSGTLQEATFRYYIEQDFQFLLRYVRVLSHAAASGDDLYTTLELTKLVNSTIDVEIDSLRDLYQRFDGDPSYLDQIAPAPTCVAYTSHLQETALKHNLLVTLAAILPCQWGYREIGRHLKQTGLPDDSRYAAWIEEYAADEFSELVDWVVERLDELARQAGPADHARAHEAFELSARYEHGFWQMAWNRESWA